MINRDLIRRKIVQLTYAYYQNGNRNMDNAEKELFFSLSKAYDLYNYQLQLIVEITKEARKRYDLEVTRVQREGGDAPSQKFAFNRFAVQLEENKMLGEWIEAKNSSWDDDIEVVRRVYTAVVESDIYQEYMNAEEDSYDADREVWRKLYKNIVMNSEDIEAMLEEKSLYWNDDKDIIDTFVLKPSSDSTLPTRPTRSFCPNTRTWKTVSLPASCSVPRFSMPTSIRNIWDGFHATGISRVWHIWIWSSCRLLSPSWSISLAFLPQ